MVYYRGGKNFRNIIISAISLVLCFWAAQLSAAESGKAPTLADLVKGAKNETSLKAQWGADTLDGGNGLQKIVAAMNKK